MSTPTTQTLIDDTLPVTWQELEARVAQILRECGYDVEVQKNVQLAGRGDVNIDVWADDHSSPPNVIAVECKHWSRPIPQREVQAFRVVVGDSGANTGLIVSSAGFQSGAREAAAYSNVRLLDWVEFQTMFAERWFRMFMSPRLYDEGEALHEYTEPINSRVSRKAGQLPPESLARFKVLRERYFLLGSTNMAFSPIVQGLLVSIKATNLPRLPLRTSPDRPRAGGRADQMPDDILDAPALRVLMDAMIEHTQRATEEFDEVFGERA